MCDIEKGYSNINSKKFSNFNRSPAKLSMVIEDLEHAVRCCTFKTFRGRTYSFAARGR